MKQFLKQHLRQSLAAAAFVFLGIIAAFFIWGIATISLSISKVTNSAPQGPNATAFNLKGAAGLDLKGLIKQ
jgi:hypothetical protein